MSREHQRKSFERALRKGVRASQKGLRRLHHAVHARKRSPSRSPISRPASPSEPLTFVSGKSVSSRGTITALTVTPLADRPGLSRVLANVAIPVQIQLHRQHGRRRQRHRHHHRHRGYRHVRAHRQRLPRRTRRHRQHGEPERRLCQRHDFLHHRGASRWS